MVGGFLDVVDDDIVARLSLLVEVLLRDCSRVDVSLVDDDVGFELERDLDWDCVCLEDCCFFDDDDFRPSSSLLCLFCKDLRLNIAEVCVMGLDIG